MKSKALIDNVNCIVNAFCSLTRVEQQQEEIDTIMNHLRGFRYCNRVQRTWDKHTEEIAAFAHVVATAQELYATDPRDKVFGLLALAPSSLRDSYRPDYASTVDDVLGEPNPKIEFSADSSIQSEISVKIDIVNNGKKALIEIAQQLAWLTAACRRPVCGELTLSDILFFCH